MEKQVYFNRNRDLIILHMVLIPANILFALLSQLFFHVTQTAYLALFNVAIIGYVLLLARNHFRLIGQLLQFIYFLSTMI